MLKISLAADHGGFELKEEILRHLISKGYRVSDCGTYSTDSVDYPDYAFKAAKLVSDGEVDFGILVCTTGEGIMMSANKVKGIRCAIGYNDEVTALSRKHNNANMIAFGQKYMDSQDVLNRVDLFLNTEFEGGRHSRRVLKIDSYNMEE